MTNYIVVTPGHVAQFERYDEALVFQRSFSGTLLNLWGLRS